MEMTGVEMTGVERLDTPLSDIPGAKLWMRVGEKTQYRFGTVFKSIENSVDSYPHTMTETADRVVEVKHLNGIPYLIFVDPIAIITGSSLTNFNFLHQSSSWRLFSVFNPQDLATGKAQFLFSSKTGLTTDPGIAIRIENTSNFPNSIRLSRSTSLELLTPPNIFTLGQNNFLEVWFTKTGSTNNWKVYCNGILVANVSNTLADNMGDQNLPLGLSQFGSSTKFRGRMGDLVILQDDAAKTEPHREAESVIIRNYYTKYPI